MTINTASGELIIKGFAFSNALTVPQLERSVRESNGELWFSCKTGSNETCVIDFHDNEFICNVQFHDGKIISVAIEYLAFATDHESYVARKDERISKTKELLHHIGVHEQEHYSWGEIKYIYDPRNLTPQILIRYAASD